MFFSPLTLSLRQRAQGRGWFMTKSGSEPLQEQLQTTVHRCEALLRQQDDQQNALDLIREAQRALDELSAELRRMELASTLLITRESAPSTPRQTRVTSAKNAPVTRYSRERESPAHSVARRLLSRGLAAAEVAQRVLLPLDTIEALRLSSTKATDFPEQPVGPTPPLTIARSTELLG